MNFNQQLAEAYQQGRQQALNETSMGGGPFMQQAPPMNSMGTPVPPRNRMGGGRMPQGAVAPTDATMFRGRGGVQGRQGRRSGREFSPFFPGTDQELQNYIDTLSSLWGMLPADLPDWAYQYDFNNDGVINGADLTYLLSQQGMTA